MYDRKDFVWHVTITLVMLQTNTKMFIEVARYLSQTYTSQKSSNYLNSQ